MKWRIACVLAAWAATLMAQTPPMTILEIDIENTVFYVDDLGDPSRIASSPVSTLPATQACPN